MTTDPSTDLLLQHLRRSNGDALWLAGESSDGLWSQISACKPGIEAMTNRVDQAITAKKQGIPCTFSDWHFTDARLYTHIYLRICKEKAINLHLMRAAWNHLIPGGELHISGEKNEGIKTCWQFACNVFSADARLKKFGTVYGGSLSKNAGNSEVKTSTYHELCEIGRWDGAPIFSKPGVYGWDKIDAGSELLIEQLKTCTSAWESANSLLDLGCGYGFLTFASSWINCERRVATDNNAAALICTEKNSTTRGISTEVIAADKGEAVEGKFDLILCNPPFHRGFAVDGDLTRQFLQSAKTKLTATGTAMFVVNSFIPLEKKASGLFGQVVLLHDTRQFKVFALRH